MAASVDDTHTQPAAIRRAGRRAAAGPSAYLVVISGPSFGEMYKLKGDRSVLGRGERADIRVLDDGVSREHAAIERDGGKMVLRRSRLDQRHVLQRRARRRATI